MAEFYSTVSDGLAQTLVTKMAQAGVDTSRVTARTLASWISGYLSTIAPTEIALSSVSPDFEQIAFQFRQALSNKNTWNDAITAATGQTLVEMVSAGINTNQLSIYRAVQESMSDTARMPTSQYIISRMLGVHIRRKVPAKVIANFTTTDPTILQSMAPYTQFEINSEKYFNREPIVFNIGTEEVTNVELFQGKVETISITSTGMANQRYVLGTSDFAQSDYDLVCMSTEGEYVEVRNGLWHYGTDARVFFSNTTSDGRIEVKFGNGLYGKIPDLNTALNFTYVTTKGSAGNSSVITQQVTLPNNNTIRGVTTSAIVGGDDEHDPDLYRSMAPHMYSAKDRAVTRDDHEAIAFDYPGVVDVIFQGQAEINPADKAYMNIVTVCAVTTEPWGTTQWTEFFDFMDTKSIYRLEFVKQDAEAIETDVTADIFCDNSANLSEVYARIKTALETFFKPRRGMLGFSVYLSDVYDVIMAADDAIQYIERTVPVQDIEVTKTQYVKLININLTMHYATRAIGNISTTGV